jgi:hypothetical protein
VAVRFTRPVPLPSTVRFEYARPAAAFSFWVADVTTGARQLTGRVE